MDGKIDADIERMTVHKKNFHPHSEITVEFFGSWQKDEAKQPPRIPPLFNLTKTIDSPANCRQTIKGDVAKRLDDGETVMLQERKGAWYRVQYKDITCWTHQRNLRNEL